MLRSATELQSYSIYAVDGDLGSVEAIVFDDEAWQVRYFLAKIGGLLGNREVRIAPEFIEGADQDMQVLYTNRTKEQVKSNPDAETDRPVADQQELAYYDYYRANPYWGVAGSPPVSLVSPHTLRYSPAQTYPLPRRVEARPCARRTGGTYT